MGTLPLVVVSLVSLAGVACIFDMGSTRVPTPPSAPEVPPDRPESRFSAALSSVPLEFSGQVVEFADYHRSRAVTGLEEAVSAEVLFQLDQRTRERYHEGLRLHPHLKSRIQRMNDLVGVDMFAFELSTWSWRDGISSPTFMLAQVLFDPGNVAGKLQALDYMEADHSGTAYYWLDEDFAPGLLFAHPLVLQRRITREDPDFGP